MSETQPHRRLRAHLRRQLGLFTSGRHWPVIVVLLTGVVVSVVLYGWARRLQDQSIRLVFEREAHTQNNAIEALLALYLLKTPVLSDFVQSTSRIDEHEFRTFARASRARQPNVLALEWAPRVTHEQRAAFEQRMRDAGYPDYEIRELQADGRLIRAGDRPVYYPVELVEPLEPNLAYLGLDLAGRPGAAEALGRAIESGEMRLSLPLRLLEHGGDADGLRAFMPVFEESQAWEQAETVQARTQRVRGVTVGVYRIMPVVEQALEVFDDPAIPISHRIYLQATASTYQAVAQASTALADLPDLLEADMLTAIASELFRTVESFELGGQHWVVVSEPAPGAVADLRNVLPLSVLITGLVLTWIVAGYFWLLINRAIEIERTVEARTGELAWANAELRQENTRRVIAERGVLQALAQERSARQTAQQAQEELAVSEARYRIMGETVPYGVWLADARGEPQYFSQSFLDLLGMTLEETRAFGWTRRLAPEEVEDTIARMRHAFHTGERVEFEHRILGPDRQYRTVLVRGLPVRNGAGQVTSWVGLNLDITERKRGEEELRQHRDYLEEVVRSRTLELMIANEELRHDIEQREKVEEALRILQENLEEQVKARTAELAAANRELEAFSYSVSHDLRAPLRHIAGFVQLLQKNAADSLSETNRRHLQVIAGAASRMGKLIDDLLQFSRMGRSAMRTVSVPVSDLVQDLRQELQMELNGAVVEWHVSPRLPRVQADPALLRVALGNLLSNALKYSRKRETIRIEVGSVETVDDQATIYIRDNGVGFDMQYADRLFGVFQRLHQADEFEGTGIGLAIVQRIIHRHGGRIWAEGAVDAGATFYVSLPRGKELNARLETHSLSRG